MSDSIDDAVTEMPAEIGLPRENGELLFESPWEARAFGLAVALHESGAFEWKLFSETLGDEITKAEAAGETSTYYERWVRALNRVTASEELVLPAEMSERSERVLREEVHEHDHDHHHE
jgi:nitrile hydratase accessory protein